MATQVTLNSGSIDSAGSLALKTNGTTTAITVDTSQNVGIGTASPGAILHTIKTSAGAATVGAFIQNSDTTVGTEVRLGFAANINSVSDNRNGWIGYVNTGGTNGGALTFATTPGGTSATERMRIDGSGNVGIGTSSPATKLEVSGGSVTASNYLINVTAATFGKASDTSIEMRTSADATPLMLFRVNGNNERMRIDSSGNVGIGTSSPNAKLQVAGDITMTGTAWTAYTPTITSGSGSFTTVSATGTYKTFGKTCWFTVAITITTVGTAGGYIGVSLPVTQAGATLAAYGMEMNSTGFMVKGYIPASGVMQVTKYDNATIIGAGYLVRLTGTYETT
jgi:hypothetical protein